MAIINGKTNVMATDVPARKKGQTWYIYINSYFYLQLKSQIWKPEKILDWEDNHVHDSHAVVTRCLVRCTPTLLVNIQLSSPYLTVIIPCVATKSASDYSKWDAQEWWSILIRTRARMHIYSLRVYGRITVRGCNSATPQYKGTCHSRDLWHTMST